jgi:hypothetical protein
MLVFLKKDSTVTPLRLEPHPSTASTGRGITPAKTYLQIFANLCKLENILFGFFSDPQSLQRLSRDFIGVTLLLGVMSSHNLSKTSSRVQHVIIT